MEAAQRSGDASALMRLMFSMGAKSDSEIIGENMDSIEFYYYQYMDNYKKPPRDIEDMAAGIVYIEIRVYFEKREIERAKSKNK